MIKKIKTTDLPDEFISSISADLAKYSVAICSINENRAEAIGSGTLIHYKDIYGVITARHVVEQFKKIRNVGLVLSKKEHRFLLEKNSIDIVTSGTGRTVDSGPDIAFIRLPETKLCTIKSICSFVNMDFHKGNILKNSDDINLGWWCLFGFPSEKVSTYSKEEEISVTFHGQCGVNSIEKYLNDGKYDYFWLKAVYSMNNNLPISFEGVSGGGLWQATISLRNTKFEVSQYLFRGVAFYQTQREDNIRLIKCHGDKSIYTYMLEHIKKKYCLQ